MRNLALVLALVATAALAAGGINLVTGDGASSSSTQKSLTDCSSGGSSAVTLTARTYLVTVTDETTWICFAASSSSCATNGTMFPAGFAGKLSLNSNQLSAACRSSGSTGDVQFTPAD